ncbi:MAG: phenylalanine--tRNA ligase subunit beta, partial [Actinomycetaceae bacterium]|nr:phenylalanine--tRNA ligase subunit beta [Actinomycetaceae bacterium]
GLHRSLAEAGLDEVLSYPFISDSWDRQGLGESDPRRAGLRLRNPLAEDAPLLRTSILDSLLDVAGRNVARGVERVAIFESGVVSRPHGTVPAPIIGVETRPTDTEIAALQAGTPNQPHHVGIVLAGRAGISPWLSGKTTYEWSDAVECVRRLASALGIRVEVTRAWEAQASPIKGAPMPPAATDPTDVAPWHPGRVARIFVRAGRELRDIALAGELHPRVCEAFGLPARTCAAEIDIDALVASNDAAPIQVRAISTYPLAKEDMAFVVPHAIPTARVEQVIRQGAGQLCEDVTLFDIYEGDQVPDGFRSLAFSLRLRADHTLTSEEITAVRNQVIDKARKVLGAELRS